MTPYLALAAAVLVLLGAGEGARRHFARERLIGAGVTAPEGAEASSWTFFDLLIIAVLVTFSAVRYGIGSDYLLYALIYEQLDTASWAEAIASSPQEVGYTVLMLALKSVFASPTALFWATSIITVVPAYVAIKQVSARPVLAILLFILLAFYLTPFNLVRQGMAISLLFFATTCLRRRPALLVAVCSLAASFHASVLAVAAVMWLASRARPTLVNVGILAVGTVGGVLVLTRFAGLGELIGRFNPRYEQYLESTGGAGIGTFLQVVIFLGLLTYAALLGRQDRAVAAQTGWLMVFVLIGVSLLVMSTQALPLGRLALFFTIYLALLLPERVAASRRPMIHDVVLVCIGLFFYLAHLSFYGGLLPYQTYFT